GPAARLGGTASAGLLYSWWATGPGAARLYLVLDAADSISDAERLCGLCAQCARQHRLWTELYQVGRPRLWRQGPAGPCACNDPGTAAGQARRCEAGRRGRALLWWLYDADAGSAPPGTLAGCGGYGWTLWLWR